MRSRLSAHIPSSFHGNAFISQGKRSPCLFLQMQEKRTAYFDICPMRTGSVRRRITHPTVPSLTWGVPAYRARKRAAYEERSMRQTVSATGAPAAVGSYSQAVKAGNLLFLSGNSAPTRETGRFERESVAAQTRRINSENIKAIIEEAGGHAGRCRSLPGLPFRHEALPGIRICLQIVFFRSLSGTDDRRQRRHIRRP